jgi:hypothetical protein
MMFQRHPAFASFMLAAYPAKRAIRWLQGLRRSAVVTAGVAVSEFALQGLWAAVPV